MLSFSLSLLHEYVLSVPYQQQYKDFRIHHTKDEDNTLKGNGNTEVFEKCSLNHGKWGHIPKQNDDKFCNHKPCNLCKSNGKRQVKVIDCIQDFFHVPDTRVAFNLFQVLSAPFVSF